MRLRGSKETMRKSGEGEHRLRERGTHRVRLKASCPNRGMLKIGLACGPSALVPLRAL